MLKGLAECHSAGSDLRCPTLFLNSSQVENHYPSSTSQNLSCTFTWGVLLKCRVCFSASQLQVTPVPLLWELDHIGLRPASILPLSCRPLPNENPVETLGLRTRDFSGGCVGPGETNSPGCGAQKSGEMLQSPTVLFHLTLRYCSSNTDCFWKVHIYTQICLFILCLPH